MKSTFIKIKPKPAPRPRVTRNGTYNDKSYTEYKNAIKLAYISAHGKTQNTNPIMMVLEFFFETPKSWSKKKKEDAKWHISRPDADNLSKSIKDALNGVAYKDDSQVCFLQVQKQYARCDGVKIEITEI